MRVDRPKAKRPTPQCQTADRVLTINFHNGLSWRRTNSSNQQVCSAEVRRWGGMLMLSDHPFRLFWGYWGFEGRKGRRWWWWWGKIVCRDRVFHAGFRLCGMFTLLRTIKLFNGLRLMTRDLWKRWSGKTSSPRKKNCGDDYALSPVFCFSSLNGCLAIRSNYSPEMPS